jgi:hypothetical protein
MEPGSKKVTCRPVIGRAVKFCEYRTDEQGTRNIEGIHLCFYSNFGVPCSIFDIDNYVGSLRLTPQECRTHVSIGILH